MIFINLINTIAKKGEWYARYSRRNTQTYTNGKTFHGHGHTTEWCACYDHDMHTCAYNFNSVVAMDRIKRVPATQHTDGAWQLAQLQEGWYTKDYDFSTDEFVMGRCEDIDVITPTQARLLAYDDYSKLDEKTKRIIWPKLYEGE